MPGGKILIFLFIALIATFGLRFVGTVPPGTGTEAPTSTKAVSSGQSIVKPRPPAPSSAGQQQQQPTPQQPVIDPSKIPQGFSANQLSPYFNKVIFSGISFPGNVILSLQYNVTSTINITGWLIQARRGGQVIPQAVNVFDSTGLAPETDIYLQPGDLLRVFPWASAIGKNFRLNKCIGALEKENHFTPSLQWYCPPIYNYYMNRGEISGYTGWCQDYISSLSYCSTPDFYSANIPYDDYACRAFLQNNVNFKGCFDKYRGDADFLKNEIWVWTSNDRLLDDRHDRILLFDKAGLLVSEYSY